MFLFMSAIVFNYIAIKILQNLSGESGAVDYGLLFAFLAAGFGSLLLSQRIRVVKERKIEISGFEIESVGYY